MSAIAVSFAQWLVCGLAAALLIDPSMRGRRLVGTAFLLGSGIAAFVLLFLSLSGVGWTAVAAAVSLGAITLIFWFAALKRRRSSSEAGRESPAPADRIGALVVDLVTIALIAGHAIYATLAPVAEWDFWAIWGLKARVFLAHGGVDWAYLEHPFNLFTHPDYPLLLPLDYSWIALFQGGWSDRWMGIVTTAFGIALLLIVRDLFELEFRGRMLAALGTLAVASFALSPWIGMAEAPLVAFGGAGLLLLRRGLMDDDRSMIAEGSVFLGLAASTKNEGLTLVIAAFIGATLQLRSRWREGWRMWPALVIPAPWLILRTLHHLQTDLTSGAMTDRAAHQLRNLPELTSALADNVPDEPLFWIAVVATLLIFARASLRRERFLTAAVLIQVLFYIGAYVVTPNDLRWHVASSWVRLLEQIAVPAGFIAVTILGRVLERGSESSILPAHEQHPRSGP